MAKKSFVLVSLNERKAKKLAEVISNDTCRKILDFMSTKKDVTESELAKSLKKPLSTVHYNMKALIESKLVKCDEYHYSPKGKEVNHYRLANQYVIIAPEGEKEAIKEKLKSILPTALIMGAAAGLIKMFSGFGFAKSAGVDMLAAAPRAAPMMAGEAMEVAESEVMTKTASYAAEPVAQAMADEAGAELMNEAVVETVQHTPEVIHTNMPYLTETVSSNAPEIALWFFAGAVAGIIVYLLVEWIVKRIRLRK